MLSFFFCIAFLIDLCFPFGTFAARSEFVDDVSTFVSFYQLLVMAFVVLLAFCFFN